MLTIERTEEMVSEEQKIPGDIWDTLVADILAGIVLDKPDGVDVGPNKCKGRSCSERNECTRYLSPEHHFQWYDDYDLYREPDGSCTYKLPAIKG